MDLKLKYKLVFWVMVFLLILNITTISVIYYRLRKLELIHTEELENKTNKKRPLYSQTKHAPFRQIKKFIFTELNLTKEQKIKVRELNRTHIKIYADSIRYYRKIFDLELEKYNPNYEKMEFAAKKIGEFHTKIRLDIADYIKNLKEILTEEQNQKLCEYFKQINEKLYKKD